MDVIINVEGGMVQAVFASDPGIRVYVKDRDNARIDDEYARTCDELERWSKEMTEVY